MTIDTIISHIEEIFSVGDTEKGEDLSQKDIAYLKYEISPQHFSKIEKALEEVYEKQTDEKPPLMSPVKTKVGNNISFRDIRLARVLLGYFSFGLQRLTGLRLKSSPCVGRCKSPEATLSEWLRR